MDNGLQRALGRIPSGLFVLASAYNGFRTGVRVEWVQRCSAEPPLVVAALATGLPVVPLIRDSHSFTLCQISEADRYLGKKFADPPVDGEDPFVSLSTEPAPSGSPVVKRAMSYLDCQVIRHIDLDSDFGLYVGHVRHGGILNEGRPAVILDME